MIGFLKADVSTADDQFGASVAMSAAGHVLMVGDPLESQIHNDSGAVYGFTHDGTQWNEYVTLKANFPWPNAGFGTSVSLNAAGDLLAVGAPYSDSVGYSRGSAHVFMLGGMGWQEQAELKAPHATVDLQFGTSVALSSDGSTLAVGARGDASAAKGVDGDQQDDSASLAGAVSLSGDGNTLVVGAPFERSTAHGINGNQDSNGSSDVGAAYVFKRHGLAWSQRAYVKAPNSGGGDNFGMRVALSADGQTLAIGAAGEASSIGGWNGAHDSNNDHPGAGAVYLY